MESAYKYQSSDRGKVEQRLTELGKIGSECANVFATHFGLGLGSIEGVIMAGWGCSARRFRGLIRVGFVVGKGEGLAAC